MKNSFRSMGILVVCLIILSIAFAGCSTTPKTATASNEQAAPAYGATGTPVANAAIACPAGFADCSGACRDITADVLNCGGCANTCPTSSTCKDSQCLCKEGFAACNGKCQDVTTDTANCGSCKNQCSVGEKCISGVCTPPGGSSTPSGQESVATCPTGLSVCGEYCIDLTSDAQNCAACGNACPNSMVCSGSQCAAAPSACSSGLTACNGYCVNLLTDNNNCGACGIVCGSGKTCTAGACVSTSLVKCRSPTTSCNGICVDLKTDENNCGSCGNKCGFNQACILGTCKVALMKK